MECIVLSRNKNMDGILRKVLKPGRYTGGEYGQIIKNKDEVKCRFAFAFPDTYEIGMSNLGLRILYGVLNEQQDIWCERVYAPWDDMQSQMKAHGIPLYAHESGDDVKDFDILGFTLQYELCYTTVLNMLQLAEIPLYASERGDEYPIVIGGGPCAYNAEPIADFFDVFSIGEGEEALVEFCQLYIKMRSQPNYTKADFLHEAAKIEGFYVPSLYKVEYNDDGTVSSYTPKYDDIPVKVRKRIIKDLDKTYFPEKFVMPYIETVHDRIVLEVYRGCPRGCRFCQAGMIYRPARAKSAETLNREAKLLYENTGYDEISLCSLSISDYPHIRQLTDKLLEWTDDSMVSLSLPSMRADSFSQELMKKISSVRSTGLTFAPEAGTQRLRDAINKNICEKDIMQACRAAFEGGRNQVKLYFMCGLPTETDEDVLGIERLAKTVVDEYYATENRPKGRPTVSISVACFIPKPFTPFQWDRQATMDELAQKQKLLGDAITDRAIRYSYHDANISRIEAVFARGDRRLSKALYKAAERGFKFDAWDECFDYDAWLSVFDECGIDPSFYANREFSEDEILPWDIIDCGVSKEFLLRERHKAYDNKTTENCMNNCAACGANKLGGECTWCPSTNTKR